jgi:hypothetical protein
MVKISVKRWASCGTRKRCRRRRRLVLHVTPDSVTDEETRDRRWNVANSEVFSEVRLPQLCQNASVTRKKEKQDVWKHLQPSDDVAGTHNEHRQQSRCPDCMDGQK